MQTLNKEDWNRLLASAFPPTGAPRRLLLLCDIPRDKDHDNPEWKTRRTLCAEWHRMLDQNMQDLGLQRVARALYPDVGSNNGDLPDSMTLVPPDLDDATPEQLRSLAPPAGTSDLYGFFTLILAPTEFSATAPLKNAARRFPFRAATMPGFCPAMIPALQIDPAELNRRCTLLKQALDPAIEARVSFAVGTREAEYRMHFDLRHRTATISAGVFPQDHMAGNLPSGETYIVPYEGELEPSLTRGELPVQVDGEVLVYTVQANRALAVRPHGGGQSETCNREIEHLKAEPAYGNMAELGFGVLDDFGLEPIGEILLDEKLAFHVAFWRSDHFPGGTVGAPQFSSPQAVIHLDRVYNPLIQPDIRITDLTLLYADKRPPLQVMRQHRYLLFSR